ncbi:MAG: hypothetical protein H0T79_02965, partial [Deltaproteobacteria bacterium]|nr:hypothetical protein [Deltaproteobacteria bacterium]
SGLEPAFVNLGGAWHGLTEGVLATTLADLRALVPAAIELVIEPGRLVARGAGFACGAVTRARVLDDRVLRMTELSRICHLRWSQVELVAPAPAAGNGERTLFAGPTCYEDDVLGEWTVPPGHFEVGARIVLRDVTGYALAWNTSFGGVPAAAVIT